MKAFIFDLRSASSVADSPVVKWGVMSRLVLLRNTWFAAGDGRGAPSRLASNSIKLVVALEQTAELRLYRMTDVFGTFAELEEAVRALWAM